MRKPMPKLRLQQTVTDAERGVTVKIWAHRKLNRRETALTLREALKGEKLKRGAVVKIYASFN